MQLYGELSVENDFWVLFCDYLAYDSKSNKVTLYKDIIIKIKKIKIKDLEIKTSNSNVY